jgi:CHAT domain
MPPPRFTCTTRWPAPGARPIHQREWEVRMTHDPERPIGRAYDDFAIEIGSGSGREYPVVVRSSTGDVRGTMRFPFDELALESRLKDLQIALLKSGGRRRQALTQEERAVQGLGQALFDTLLADEVRRCYDDSLERADAGDKGLRLKLVITAPELAVLPWEYLYDPDRAEYLSLSAGTPIVRYLDVRQPVRSLQVTPPLRILAMVANPSDLEELDVERERTRVERATERLRAAGLLQVEWLDGQGWRDLQRAMRGGPWHIFHFIGHGGFDRSSDEGFVALVGDDGQARPQRATELARLLADHRSLRLVFLNACEGAREGGATSSPARQRSWSGGGCRPFWRCSTKSPTRRRLLSPRVSTRRWSTVTGPMRPWPRRARR